MTFTSLVQFLHFDNYTFLLNTNLLKIEINYIEWFVHLFKEVDTISRLTIVDTIQWIFRREQQSARLHSTTSNQWIIEWTFFFIFRLRHSIDGAELL